MTTLFLMRHARAGKAAEGTKDFDRPLTETGAADAREMGRVLRARYQTPERVICSAARRTRETLEALGLRVPAGRIALSDALFDSDGDGYIEALRQETAASILLIGHNPSIHDAAMALTRDGDGVARGALAAGFPTAAFAVLDWPDAPGGLPVGACFLQAFLAPTGAGRD